MKKRKDDDEIVTHCWWLKKCDDNDMNDFRVKSMPFWINQGLRQFKHGTELSLGIDNKRELIESKPESLVLVN